MDVIQSHRKRVGSQIKAARVQSRQSHDTLAAKVGTSRQHLIKLEKGKHLPGPEMLARIATATGKSVDFFSTGGSSDDEEEAADLAGTLLQTLRRFVREEMQAAQT